MNPPRRPKWWGRLEEDEDDQVRAAPDHAVRADATRVRTPPKPEDFRDNRGVLPANYARPPSGWEFPNGRTDGIPGHQLILNVGRSKNVEDRRPGRQRGIGAAIRNLMSR